MKMADSQTFGYLNSIDSLKTVFIKHLFSAILENPKILRADLYDGVAGNAR